MRIDLNLTGRAVWVGPSGESLSGLRLSGGGVDRKGRRPTEDLMLAEVPLKQEVILVRMDVAGADLEPLLERGIVPGCRVCPVRRSPGGGPTVYRIDGNLVALRRETASCLCVRSALEAAGILKPN